MLGVEAGVASGCTAQKKRSELLLNIINFIKSINIVDIINIMDKTNVNNINIIIIINILTIIFMNININIIVASGCAVPKMRLDVLWGARSPFLLLPSTILTLSSPLSFPSSTSSTSPSSFSSSYYTQQS